MDTSSGWVAVGTLHRLGGPGPRNPQQAPENRPRLHDAA
jgi:hypothetical protein